MTSTEPKTIVELERYWHNAGELWAVSGIHAHDNAPMQRDLRSIVEAALFAHGLTTLDRGCAQGIDADFAGRLVNSAECSYEFG